MQGNWADVVLRGELRIECGRLELGTEWEIGPAKASTGGNRGPDPATDHTPSSDNGVAGVVIGGNTNAMLHGLDYLQSPPFDTTAPPRCI